jgi:sulfonate transport system substrate-binding protein
VSVVALAGVVVTACGTATGTATGPASAPTTTAKATNVDVSDVTLNVGDQAGTGAEALLTASGLLRKLPFKVAWSDFTSGPPMLQAMGAGAIDVGGVGDAPPIFAAAGGAQIAIVGAFHNDADSAALLVPKGSPITSITQLRGKRIAVSQGSSADYHLLTVLKKAGLGVHDVTLEYLQPAEGLTALTSGSADAWDVWSPFVEQAVAQDGARILVNGNGYGSNFSYVVASRSALADPQKAAAIRDYLALLDKAHVWANKHPAAWAKVWAQGTGLPDSVMVKAAKDDSETAVPITASIVATEQGLVEAFANAGLIPKKFDFADYSDNAFNSVVSGAS